MFTLILIVHVIVSILLIVIILMQEAKGGMSSMFGGSNESLFGATGAGKFFTKLTTVLAGIFMLTSLTLALLSKRPVQQEVEVPTLPPVNQQQTTPLEQQNNNVPEIPVVPQGETNTQQETK